MDDSRRDYGPTGCVRPMALAALLLLACWGGGAMADAPMIPLGRTPCT